MKKEKFIELFSKKLSGEIVEEESVLLNRMTQDNEEYRLLSVKLDSYFKEKADFKPNITQLSRVWEMIEVDQNENFNGKFDYSAPKKSPFAYMHLLKVAAMLVVLVGTGILGYHLLGDSRQDFDTLTTAEGKVFKMLDDGTKVWLNKNSTLNYNKAFGKHKREITLEGEAYFDVVKNKDIPLFIHAGNIDIEVKGTAFNVNAYKENPEIQVALLRGAIQVTDRLDNKHQVFLKPNEKLIFSNTLSSKDQNNFKVMSLAANVLLKDTKWTADTLVFHKEKLKDLILRMEKKYDLKITIESEQLREKRFSGTFTNETIQQVLEALKLSYPLTYTINNRLVVIKD